MTLPTPLMKRPKENLGSNAARPARFPMISKIVHKLRDPEYRKAFVASQINIGIPFQLRAMLKDRDWTQEKLAERTGMLQPRISAILKPGKTRLNIETLRRLAEAFDCALIVRFAPFSELINWSDKFRPDEFRVPAFDEEVQTEERDHPTLDRSAMAPIASSSSEAAPIPAIQASLEFGETAGVQLGAADDFVVGKGTHEVININLGRKQRGRRTRANRAGRTAGFSTDPNRRFRKPVRKQCEVRIDPMGSTFDLRAGRLGGQTANTAYSG
jgi:transcriptional regulator with XRE-family HTH domain